MDYRTLGRTGIRVSAVSMGCWNIGGQWGDVAETDAIATIRRGLDLGVTLFDTADAYGVNMGASEELLGKALADVRDKVVLVSKVGNWGRRFGHPLPYTHPTHVIGCCHASLHRLRTDHLDVLLCHVGDLKEPAVFLEGLDTLKRQGKIRAYGISTNSPDVIAHFNMRNTCDVVQFDYSLLNRTPEETILPYCITHNIGTMARGVLAMGLLSGQYNAETKFTDQVRQGWNAGAERERYLQRIAKIEKIKAAAGSGQPLSAVALAYVLGQAGISCAIPGAKSPRQMEANVAAGDVRLTDSQRAALQDAAKN